MSGFNVGDTSAGFASVGPALGSSLMSLMVVDDIQPGDEASYQLCKTIYIYHPLGAKMAGAPISIAQSQAREIAIPNSPEDRVREAFLNAWETLNADNYIFRTMEMSRVYGVSTLVWGIVGKGTDTPLDFEDVRKADPSKIYFNVLDPINTSGTMTFNQDPNSPDFQRTSEVVVAGQRYHSSRACVMQNENPIYISFTNSGFGYSGRSVYQRALFPMKSFVQTMITDDMVSRKAGVLIAKMKPAGSITDRIMQAAAGFKRNLLKEAQTNNVLSISIEESIETLNMMNVDAAMNSARSHILENCAVAADMPAMMLNSETFAQGLAQGSEDAKSVARYIDRIRVTMKPLYILFDKIAQAVAWTPEFYETIQAEFDDYKAIPFQQAYTMWVNSFAANWPSLLTEPDSEKIKVEEAKHKAITGTVEVWLPVLDPDNKASLLEWTQDNLNENKMLFPNPLNLDIEAFATYEPPPPPGMEGGDSGTGDPNAPPGAEAAGGGAESGGGTQAAKEPAPPRPEAA
jgi:hypothetical protein